MKKREFLKSASGAAIVAFYGISLSSCGSDEDPNTVMPTNNEDLAFKVTDSGFTSLASEGGWKNDLTSGILLVNIDGDAIRAFTNICTHTQCNNNWEYASPSFTCTCHNSVFANDGSVTSGPATSNLREFDVSKSGDTYTVKLS